MALSSGVKMGDKLGGLPGDQHPAGNVVVRYKGPFDYTHVYRTIERWFEQRRFRFYESRTKDTGKRIKDDMWAERQLDEFMTERYDIKVEMWKLSRSEIVVNGQPRVILNGMAQFTIKGAIRSDPGEFFKSGKLRQFLGRILLELRWREVEMKYIDIMEYRLQDVQTVVKKSLNMTLKQNAPWFNE